jgi:small subunit ribosomal protein S2
MAVISMRALLETGVHFGHRARRWNPKMQPYIFTERNGIHIIDLQQTLGAIEEAYAMIRDAVAQGGILLFVGTKRQAQEAIETEATRCGMPYVNQRWQGGTLTNWRTIRERIQYLRDLESRRERGEFELVTKKEALMLTRKIERLSERLGGIRDMPRLPSLLFMVDTMREDTAVREANTLNIPIIAMVDTNCNPESVDLVIPANDDAIRAIKLIAAKMADAVLEGSATRKEELQMLEIGAVSAPSFDRYADEQGDEVYLGEATLAKMRGFAVEPEEMVPAELEVGESADEEE